MFVELVYDKRNVAGLPNAAEIIRNELENACMRCFLKPKCA